jgi:hypothetical protein
MAQQSYKVSITGEGPLVNVACILELINVVQMKKETDKKWIGEIENIEVFEKLDYEIFISSIGKVKFTYVIHNTKSDNEVENDNDYTNRNVINGAKVRSNCKPA